MPRRADGAVTRAWLRLYRRRGVATLERLARSMDRHLPAPWHGEAPARLAERQAEARIEDMWGRVRGLWGRGYRPETAIDGLEHLERALERGRGVIVWCMRVGSATVIKLGLAASGHPLVHLSRAQHGSTTTTALGLKVVAPLYRRVEDRELAERVEIPRGGSLAYLRTLERRLADNCCVSIFGEHSGRGAIEVEVLGIRREMALGAPSLAWRTGAGLVTAYARREAPFHHRVVIEEEMPIDRDRPRKEEAERAVLSFARRLEAVVQRHPEEWHGWFYLDSPSASRVDPTPPPA